MSHFAQVDLAGSKKS